MPRRPSDDLKPGLPTVGGWQTRHLEAIRSPHPGAERAIVGRISGWLTYAEPHERHHGSKVGEDGDTGPYGARIGGELIGLLSCERGRLDGGTLASIIGDP